MSLDEGRETLSKGAQKRSFASKAEPVQDTPGHYSEAATVPMTFCTCLCLFSSIKSPKYWQLIDAILPRRMLLSERIVLIF
uniref:Uncharacterized protein n=1 Tax=Steinernema glaseri TaxID=37863 RepID=A0A1I7ZWW5_9BILA